MAEERKITHTLVFDEAAPRVSEFKRFIKVFFGRWIVVLGVVVIFVFLITALFAPFLAPYDPYKQVRKDRLSKPSWEHPLGTDSLGRDTMSRIIYGSRTSLTIGFVAIALAASIGMVLGLTAGYFGGITNTIIMRFIDALMAFPMVLLALTIAALLGGGVKNIIIALGIGLVPPYARLMCAQVLQIKEHDYVLAARVIGSSNLRIMLRHIAPNCFPPLIVLITMLLGVAILAEASLSFLGIGINPPGAAWGAMVNEGYQYLTSSPILSFVPGMAIMVVVFAFNMVGDGLRDALDPKLRGTI